MTDIPAFLFTTENQDAVDLLKPKGKRILAVCAGGGDPVFRMVELGAEQIDLFDISLNTKYLIELKLTAIKNLSFSDFRKFFNINNKNEYDGGLNFNKLNFEIYDNISSFLSKECKSVFDSVKDGQIDISQIVEQKGAYRVYDSYVCNVEHYKRIKSSLSTFEIHFIHSSLKALPPKLIGSYDVIYLSNIHIKAIVHEQDSAILEIKNIAKFLQPNGVIFVNYIYNYNALNEYVRLTDLKYDMAKTYERLTEFTHQVHYVNPNRFEMKRANIDNKEYSLKLSEIVKNPMPIRIRDQVHILQKLD